MRKFIFIELDENDADCRSSLLEISDTTLEIIKPIVEAIKNNSDNDYGNNYLTEERESEGKSAQELYGNLEGFELWENLVPFSEYGFHTLTDVRIFHVEDIEHLLD